MWLSAARTTPLDFYQHWLRTADGDAVRFAMSLTFLPAGELADLLHTQQTHPERRVAQTLLAEHLTLLVHGRMLCSSCCICYAPHAAYAMLLVLHMLCSILSGLYSLYSREYLLFTFSVSLATAGAPGTAENNS